MTGHRAGTAQRPTEVTQVYPSAMKEQLSRLILQALDSLIDEGTLPGDISRQVQIDRTRDPEHGDLASNIAMALAKPARKNPRELATLIC